MNSFSRKIFVILLLIYSVIGLNELQGQTVQSVNDNIKCENWSYYKTTDSTLGIHEIQKKFAAAQFSGINQSILNAGIAREYYWIHFNLTNTSADVTNLVIDIDNSRLNEIELFEVSKDTIQSLGKLGDFYPFHQRPVLNKNFLYQVFLMSDQKKEFFLSVNQVGSAFILPVKIYNSKNFNFNTFNDYLFDGVTYGILLFVAVMSLLFFITTKRILYLCYGLYIISAILWFLSYFGLGYQYLWPNHPALNTAMSPCMAAVNIFLNLQICQILLKLSKANRTLNSFANYTKLVLLLCALFPFVIDLNKYGYALNHGYLIIFLGSILFAMLLVSSGVIMYAIKGIMEAKFYLVASLLKAGSIINLALLELGITPAFYNMEGFLQVGIFIEIALLTYALAIRYTNYKMKMFERVIEAQEKERFVILKEIHESISGTLTGINLGIKNFVRDNDYLPADKKSQLQNLFNELKNVQLEARSISHNTMPDHLKESNIKDIAEKYIEDLQTKIKNNSEATDSIEINFSANEQLVNFSEAVKLNVFRIVQELLTNILKHSKAANAEILFSFDKKEMMIIAEDDGIGFFHSEGEDSTGVGMKNISFRIDLLDGDMEIKSPIHKRLVDPTSEFSAVDKFGTLIKIRIPYRNNLSKNSGYDY